MTDKQIELEIEKEKTKQMEYISMMISNASENISGFAAPAQVAFVSFVERLINRVLFKDKK